MVFVLIVTIINEIELYILIKIGPNMNTITRINDGLFVHLSNHAYDLNVIHKTTPTFKITTQQKICFYGELLSLRKDFMQANTIVSHHYLIVVDVDLNWSIYCIKTVVEQPQAVYSGKIMC